MSDSEDTKSRKVSQEEILKQAELQISLGFISAKALAAVAGYSPATIRDWKLAGELVPMRKPGTKTDVYDVNEVRQFMGRSK